MPYSPSGIYSLIASYFARPGQTIRTEQHNPVLEDIQSALSSVLLRDGRAPMTGLLRLADSGWAFASEPSLGMYRKAPGVIGIAGGSLDGAIIAAGLATIDLTQPPYNLVLNTPTVDQADIIQQACDDYEGQGVNLVIPANGTPTVGVGSTISIPHGVTLQGGNGLGGHNQAAQNFTGVTLSWLGGDGGTMVHMQGLHHSEFKGFLLDGNGKSEMVGLHLSSVNDPASSYNFARHFVAYRCQKGIVLGDPGDTSYAPEGTDPNNIGRAQNDSFVIEDFMVIGDGTDTTAKGIHINGTNTGQSSIIRQFCLQSVNLGIDLIQNNGQLKIQHGVGGAPVGSNSTWLRAREALFVPPLLEQNEVEGSWTYAVHDSSNNYHAGVDAFFSQYTQMWLNNAWNAPVLIDGTARILSLGNSGGSPTAEGFEWVAAGTSHVISIMDTTPDAAGTISAWQTSGTGKVSQWGDITGQITLMTDNVIAGDMPSGFPLGRGSLAASGAATEGRVYLGSDGQVYFIRGDAITTLRESALVVGDLPSNSPGSGEIQSAVDATTGRYYFGADGNAHLSRTNDDADLTLPVGGTLSINGSAVLTDGSAVGGGGTAAPGTFTALEATSQLKVPVGSAGTPSIYSATPDVGMYFSASTGVIFEKGGANYANFGPTGFNTYRSGNANVSALGRTDAHGANATITQFAAQGVDSGGNTTNFARTDTVAVTVTDGSEEGRIDTRVSVAGALSIITQAGASGFNVAAGGILVGGTSVIDSNRLLKLRSYTVATLPSQSTGAMIYVSDGTSNKRLAVSDGTNWRFPDGAVVS